MPNWIFASFCLVGFSLCAQPTNVLLPTTTPKSVPTPAQFLAWDAMLKEYEAKPGETNANFTFNLTNISTSEVVINGTQTTCGCTVAKLPSQPWKMAPGDSGQINVSVNLVGKPAGAITKGVTILSSVGAPMILVKVLIPPPAVMSEAERVRNAELSKADAQAIFKGSCAACHVTPGQGRLGGDLYTTMCAVCHESSRRADSVPNLHSITKPTDYEFWKSAIAFGRTNSLMPGFAIAQGGPLTDQQVDSLADFLNKVISRNVSAPAQFKKLTPGAVQIPPPPARPMVPAVQVPSVPSKPTLN